MNQWTQFEEDTYRLPEGMKRIGYDADTTVYTFRDRTGILYQGAPGADYGVLTPVSKNATGTLRPGAFDSGEPRKERPSRTGPPATFGDILPPSLLTTPSSSLDGQSPRSPKFKDGDRLDPHQRFVNVVRRAALPKMQGVVQNLRNSMATARHKQPNDCQGTGDDAEEPLICDTFSLGRSSSLTTTNSVDTEMTTSRKL